jgi:hypothetical protein
VSQRWGRTGSPELVLDSDSALLQLPDHVEVAVPLQADHSMIVKFDHRSDNGYGTAIKYLRQFQKDAPDVVAKRFCTYLLRSSGYLTILSNAVISTEC